MKKLLAASVAAAALGAAASGAHAQSWTDGVYVAGDVGYSWAEGLEAKSNVLSSSGQPYNWTFNREDTPVGYLRLGKRFAPNWRLELEGGYRNGDIETVRGSASGQPIGLCTAGVARTAAAPTCADPRGELRVGSVMVNALYDFMPDSKFNPFIGIGGGMIEAHNKVFGQLSAVPAGGRQFQNASFDDVDRALAAQAIVGVSYALSPNWNLDLTGRYLQSADLKFGSVNTNAGAAAGVGTITNTGVFKGDYRETTATIGVRYTFAAPPPPPPPPPPPRRLPRRLRRLRLRRPRRLRRSWPRNSSSTSRSISMC